MPRLSPIACLAASLLLPSPLTADEAPFEPVAKILEANCLSCHNPGISKGELDLSTLSSTLHGGENGTSLVPNDPNKSPLFTKILPRGTRKPSMPKEGDPLTAAEHETLERWIASGAPWPEDHVLREPSKADAKTWWAYQPLKKVDPPPVASAPSDNWNENPIDRFILTKLQSQGLQPNPPASPEEWIRRATYDLTGLPPTPKEVEDFRVASIQNPKSAIRNATDRLLASPRYGEKWGRHWLDVTRFGESNGFERNVIINNLWPYRDYVIKSLNDDKPFDQFFKEHLAGDAISPGNPDTEAGVIFLTCGPYDNVGNQDAKAAAQIRANTVDEIIRATSETFLGLTVGCARCHDHKFDPILQRDYYALYATFDGVSHGDREIESPEKRAERIAKISALNTKQARYTEQIKALGENPDKATLAEIKKASNEVTAQLKAIPPPPKWWAGKFRDTKSPAKIFLGGDPQRKGKDVTPGGLTALAQSVNYHLPADSTDRQRRLQLSDFLVSKENPLTPRVLANRVWHWHFGRGIVPTPSDFGYMGGRPSHPELLDSLACFLRENGWRLKPLHRLIMTSQTYRQSSRWNQTAAAKDADSQFLWRFPPKRLTAEELRDTMLVLGDKMDFKMGGPGFRLYEYQQDNVATYVPLEKHGPETYRRAIYHQNARAAPVDVMAEFDCPDPAAAEPRRASTVTPLQALTMMNHPFSLDMANAFATRIQNETPKDDKPAQIDRAFRYAYARPPTETERENSLTFLQSHPLRALTRALLNSNELLYLP